MFDQLVAAIHAVACSRDHDGVGPCRAIASRLVHAFAQHRLSIVDEVGRDSVATTLEEWDYPELHDALNPVKVPS